METVTEEVTFFFDGFEEQGEGDVSRPHTSDSGERTVGDASQPHTSDSGERTVAAKEIEATPTVTTKSAPIFYIHVVHATATAWRALAI